MLMSLAQEGMSPPAHGRELARLLALFFANCQDRLRWRDVVARTFLDFILGLETLGQMLFRMRQSVSVTHELSGWGIRRLRRRDTP